MSSMYPTGSTSTAPVTQTLSGNGSMSANVDMLYVTAAATVTLPAVSDSQIGKETSIFVTSATRIVVVLAASGSDKIEGASYAFLVATRGIYTLTPVTTNRWELTAQRGLAQWQHARYDLTTASGASPWTIGGATFTDISSAGSSVTAATGLEKSSKSSSSYTGAASADCCVYTVACTGVTDGWSRALDPTRHKFYVLGKTSKTTTVGGSSPSVGFSLGGSALSGVPRVSSHISGTTGVANQIARDSASRSLTLVESAFTSAGWIGFLWDPNTVRLVTTICTTAPSGSPGTDWTPSSYEASEGMRWGQDTYGVQWALASLTHIHSWQTTPTTGSKFKDTELVVIMEIGAPG